MELIIIIVVLIMILVAQISILCVVDDIDNILEKYDERKGLRLR